MSKNVATKLNTQAQEWAKKYGVGDTISFQNPVTDKIDTAKIIGFSTLDKHLGLPVVKAEETDLVDYRGTIAIQEKYHVNGK